MAITLTQHRALQLLAHTDMGRWHPIPPPLRGGQLAGQRLLEGHAAMPDPVACALCELVALHDLGYVLHGSCGKSFRLSKQGMRMSATSTRDAPQPNGPHPGA